MFERYNESARRVIFYARHEASRYGSDRIDSAHLLLGLLQEDPHLFRLLLSQEKLDALREDLARRLQAKPPTPTSIDMPLAPDASRVLARAAEEAERMAEEEISTKHLLLGMLGDAESGAAARVLEQHGLQLSDVRVRLAMRRTGSNREVANPAGLELSLVVDGKEKFRLPYNAFTLPRYGDVLIFDDQRFATTAVRFHYDRQSLRVVKIEVVAEQLAPASDEAAS